jgi:hypothetical protein
MSDSDDAALDLRLREALAPPEGPADRVFVVRVERAVAEAERFRRSWAALLGQLASELLAVGAVAASLTFIAQAPQVRGILAQTPELGWLALPAMILVWLLVRRRGGVLA